MIKNNLFRPCPVCAGTSGEVLHTQRFAMPEGHPLPESYDVVCCTRCGFVYADTSAKQKDYDLYYERFSKYEDPKITTGSGVTSYDEKRCKDTALAISEFVPDRRSEIVDIGCANGGVLAALKHLGYENLFGIDPSAACVNYVKETQGIQAMVGGVFSQNVADNRLFESRFDCVIFSHVMEHIYDVWGAIGNISYLLKPSGILYLETPDASRYKDFFVVPYYYYDCEHINHFDEHSLRNLLMSQGYDFMSFSKAEIKPSASIRYPSVFVMAKKTTIKGIENEPLADFSVKESVLAHLEKSKIPEQAIRDKLEPLINSESPVIVWGAGNFMLRLLENSPLGKCNIRAFIDNDSKKWGSVIRGVSVFSPEKLKELKGTLIICSAIYSDDIYNQAKSMEIDNEIVVLR